MILKRSRRNDIISHLENGIFIILLKHTNNEQANATIERIDNMISLSNYIVDSQSIEIELDFALSKIDPNKTKEHIVAQALEKLPS
jgi:GGDEF domain-containing protein